MPSWAHFWVHSVYTPAWVSYSVRSIGMASDGQSYRRAGVDTPFFVYVGINEVRNSLTWVFVRAN